MADPTPEDLPTGSTNGKVKQDRESIEFAVALRDDQTLAERDQTLADADQTLSDSDQTAADTDQATADSDRAAADLDQEASDRDLVDGGDPAVHDFTRGLRDRSTRQRAMGGAYAARHHDADCWCLSKIRRNGLGV